jgi:hypothetical protein
MTRPHVKCKPFSDPNAPKLGGGRARTRSLGLCYHFLLPKPVSGLPGDCSMNEQETPSITFNAFVISLARTAAIHFGDVGDPATGDFKPNFPAAAQLIEILALLEQKTRGNLTAEERSLLEEVLYELRLRFVSAKAHEEQQAKRIVEP